MGSMENSKKVGSVTTGSSKFETTGSSDYSSEPSGSRKHDNGRYTSPAPSWGGATSSVYTVDMPEASFQTMGTYASDVPSEAVTLDQSTFSTKGSISTKGSRGSQPAENIRLMPFKVKDVMEMIKDNPTYKDKSPVMIKVKENDIDQLIEKQKYKSGDNYEDYTRRESPVSLGRSLKDEGESLMMSTGTESVQFSKKRHKSRKESTKRSAEKPFLADPPLGGADRTQKVFAMPEVQAFPAVVHPGRPRRRAHHVSPAPRRSVSRSRSRRGYRPRPVRRESIGPRYRTRRVVRRPLYRRRYASPCTPFPMCDNVCRVRAVRSVFSRTGSYYADSTRRVVSNTYNRPYYADGSHRVISDTYNTPYYADSRRLVTRTRSRPYYAGHRQVISRMNCSCNMCSEKLQFIQPGLCSKKKNMWTNEYAVIPKPQINLIDPCEELDPTIYPRAENPCIRDGQGNPLTDCIGRPLRSPIGKRFLNFSGNGSVMDTNFRGNFWTGQPPLCVKCPMPSCSCAPDTTHNWWMNCGYPIMPNMNPFFKRVIATETTNCY